MLRGDSSGIWEQIDAYVYDPCGGCYVDAMPCKPCTVVMETERYLSAELARGGLNGRYTAKVNNLLYESVQEELGKRLPKAQWSALEYPIMFIGKKQLYGWLQIKKEFPVLTEVLPAPEYAAEERPLIRADRDTIVYFKMQGCRSCEETEPILERLKKKYPDCDFTVYDIEEGANQALWVQYCHKYGIDPINAVVPMVMIGDSVLEGAEEIEMFLEFYLDKGYAKNTYCAEKQ